jgi:hypothetical protein
MQYYQSKKSFKFFSNIIYNAQILKARTAPGKDLRRDADIVVEHRSE